MPMILIPVCIRGIADIFSLVGEFQEKYSCGYSKIYHEIFLENCHGSNKLKLKLLHMGWKKGYKDLVYENVVQLNSVQSLMMVRYQRLWLPYTKSLASKKNPHKI
jgi:hypothetical protein